MEKIRLQSILKILTIGAGVITTLLLLCYAFDAYYTAVQRPSPEAGIGGWEMYENRRVGLLQLRNCGIGFGVCTMMLLGVSACVTRGAEDKPNKAEMATPRKPSD